VYKLVPPYLILDQSIRNDQIDRLDKISTTRRSRER